jgi:tRNA(fMet)-specific endonuclease VapC
LRAELAAAGKPLGPLDLLIAAQAREIDAILVTNDHAFANVKGLALEDWTRSGP